MKPFKLLIAYDSSESSKTALQGLSAAGLPKSLEAVVLAVVDTWLPADQALQVAKQDWLTREIAQSVERKKALLNDAKLTAWSAAEALRIRFPTWTIRAEAKADSPAWGIVKFADEWQPDLVILGSRGRSALGRFVLGSVSQQVLTHTRGSVRIIHPESNLGGAPRLIIGYDASTNARLVITRLAQRPWPQGTLVRLVSIMDERIAHLADVGLKHQRNGHSSHARREFWNMQVLRPALQELKKAGLKTEVVIRDGNPIHVLLREAKRWHANSIFLGARGLTMIERFLLGSVSTQIAAKGPCTVEVVR